MTVKLNLPPCVEEADVRPARPDGTSFYCHKAVGQLHSVECVRHRRKVRLRLTVEYEVDVPNSWSEEQINFHYQESSYCADNVSSDLEAYAHQLNQNKDCLCGRAKIEYVRDVE